MANVVKEPIDDEQAEMHIWPPSNFCGFGLQRAYLVHFFSGIIYSTGLKFLRVIYESFDCDLTEIFYS